MACWRLSGSVGLEREVSAGEAARFPRRVAVAGGPYPEAEVGVGEAIEVAGRLLSEIAGGKERPWEADLLINLAENAVRTKIPANHDDFSKPGRGREVGLRSCLDFYRTIDV